MTDCSSGYDSYIIYFVVVQPYSKTRSISFSLLLISSALSLQCGLVLQIFICASLNKLINTVGNWTLQWFYIL